MLARSLGPALALALVASLPVPASAQANGTGIREVSASGTQPDSAANAAALHDDGRPAGRRGDPRRHLWRQGLLGHQLDAQHRAREARERGRRHEPESRDGQRRRLLVPAHREGRHRHAGPQGVRERRSERAAGQAEVLQRGAGRRPAERNWRKPGPQLDAANRRTTESIATYQQQYPGKLQFVYGSPKYAKPFLVRSIWHDGQFTYIKADATELPALYEVKDGKPALLNFQVQNGTYVVPKVLDHGYLSLGKERFEFLQQGR